VKELLEEILEIRWTTRPSVSDSTGYYFTIGADNRDKIIGNVNQALVLLEQLKEIKNV
ncbi:unnamed protein product, partial [marine sediment metagenome]